MNKDIKLVTKYMIDLEYRLNISHMQGSEVITFSLNFYKVHCVHV